MSIATLRSQIWNLRVENAEGRRFVPRGELRGIFTRENVAEALRESGVKANNISTTVNIVLSRATIIFAVLLHIREAHVILSFIANDQLQPQGLDHCLPFPEGSLDFLDPEMAGRFWEAQWEFTAPVFPNLFFHFELDPLTVMPSIKLEESEILGNGAFGTVYLLELHPRHHELHHLSKDGKLKIVRKEINRIPRARRSINGEQRVLSVLNNLKHPNILELLGSYTLLGKQNLLFPRASQSLGFYLSGNDPHLGFPSQSSVILALPGLASAIQALHSYTSEDVSLIGCHHDIKPSNILIMDGRFILADFGLSTLKDPSEGSKTYFRYGQGFYYAPECEDFDDSFQRHGIGRSSDIWSFGCVLLELLVFLEFGASGVKDFQKDRRVTFTSGFSISAFHFGKASNQGVERYINKLHQTLDGSKQELVTLIRVLLQITPSQRPKAPQLSQSLRSITLKYIACIIIDESEDLDNESLPYDFVIEMERFRCWNKDFTAGISSTALSVPHVVRDEIAHQAAVDHCIRIRKNIDKMKSDVSDTHDLVTTLQHCNDDLAKMLEE